MVKDEKNIEWLWINPQDNNLFMVADKHKLLIWNQELNKTFEFYDGEVDFKTLAVSNRESTLYVITTESAGTSVVIIDVYLPSHFNSEEEIKLNGKSFQHIVVHDATRSVYTVNDFTSVYKWDLTMRKPKCIVCPRNRTPTHIQDMAVSSI
jgi:hypothetical protein